MKAIITVMGSDRPGIVAAVTANLAENNINILDISQTTLNSPKIGDEGVDSRSEGIFTMIMLVDMTSSKVDVSSLSKELDTVGESTGVAISVQHEDIFNSMHRV